MKEKIKSVNLIYPENREEFHRHYAQVVVKFLLKDLPPKVIEELLKKMKEK